MKGTTNLNGYRNLKELSELPVSISDFGSIGRKEIYTNLIHRIQKLDDTGLFVRLHGPVFLFHQLSEDMIPDEYVSLLKHLSDYHKTAIRDRID